MTEEDRNVDPKLGSDVLVAERAQATLYSNHTLSSGCQTIDQEALQGGFRYGEIASLAGSRTSGSSLVRFHAKHILQNFYQIAYHAIASHLLHGATGPIAYIDTTGLFSPLRLHRILVQRMKLMRKQRYNFVQSGYMYEKQAVEGHKDALAGLEQEAGTLLERVNIMRVFDLPGVLESLREVGQTAKRDISIAPTPTYEVADSQDEEATAEISERADVIEPSPQQMMVVIDCIANVTGIALSKSQVNGQALLSRVMRELRLLATDHRLCCLLVNETVGGDVKSARAGASFSNHQSVSIFSSNYERPALGRWLSYELDISILLFTIPQTRKDAINQYRGNATKCKVEQANIFEVLGDHQHGRGGRWAAFQIASDVSLRSL